MTTNVGINEAQERLKEIISKLRPNEEIVITENDQPIARLTATAKGQPTFGNCKGMLIINEGDDGHLADFEEYMP